MGIGHFLKDIGKGSAGSRGLTQLDAQALMCEVLAGRVSAAETGAFLMAMRMRGETLDELIGFARAAQAHCLAVPGDQPVLLLPSYGGAGRLPNLTALLALWLARQGLRVLMHGPLADSRRLTSADVLHGLGVAPALQLADVDRAWSRREPAYVPTRVLCPALQTLLDMRRLLGLRGPAHRVAKMLNPVPDAPALRLVSHTDPAFGALMAAWVQREGIDAMLLRATEGEPVADPRRQPRIDTWVAGHLRPELSCPAQEGVLAELPLLPREADAAGTAMYVQEVLSGMRPAPPPLVRQAALIEATMAALQARPTTCERMA